MSLPRCDRARPTARAWLAVAFLAVMGGCATTRDVPRGPSTGGISLTLRYVDEASTAVLLELDRDGMLAYGGGADALLGRTSWRGAVTEAEVAELQRLLDVHGWYGKSLPSTGVPAERVYRIELKGPQGRRGHKVVGRSAAVEPVYDLLMAAARRRLEPDLQRLPKPTERPES